MADKMLRVAGRGTDGTAKAIKTDNLGNLGTTLSTRNELATYATETITAVGMKSVINRFDNLKDYSAVMIGLSLPESTEKIKITASWYIQKPGEQYGTQVSSETLLDTTTTQRFMTNDYLPIKGTQLSIVVVNGSDAPVDATVYVMGIR